MIFGGLNKVDFNLQEILLRFLVIFIANVVALTMAVTVLTMGAAIANMQHFGEGLMERLQSTSTLRNDDEDTGRDESYALR